MTARLLLIGLVVAAVLGGTLLLLEDGEPADAPAADGPDLAAPADATPDAEPLPEGLPGGETAATPESLAALVPAAGRGAEEVATVFDADGRLGGRVFDRHGNLLVGVPVQVLVEQDDWQDSPPRRALGKTSTDADGRFELPARAGALHVVLVGGDRWPRARVEKVSAGDDLTVRLEDARVLKGRVTDEESGLLLEGAHVVVFAEGEVLHTLTDGEGAFRVEPLATDTVMLASWTLGHDLAFLQEALVGFDPVDVELPPGRLVLGTVLDAELEQPLPGTVVTLRLEMDARRLDEEMDLPQPLVVHEEEVVTDEAGRFTFEEAPSTGFALSAEVEGFAPFTLRRYEERVLDPEDEVTLKLQPLGELPGRTRDGEDLMALPGVAVALVQGQTGGQVLQRAVSDEEGHFTLPLAGWDGESALFVDAETGDGRRGRARVRRKDREEGLEVELLAPVTVPVLVTTRGEPVQGAQVVLRSSTGPETLTLGHTGEDGRLDLVHPLSSSRVESLELQARRFGAQSLWTVVELEGGPPTEPVEVDVGGGVFVEGVVVDPFGQPVASALVRDRRRVFRHTDHEGRFEIGPFEPGGSCHLNVEADGFQSAKQVLRGLTGHEDEVVFVLDPVVLWTGLVVDGLVGQTTDRFLVRLQHEVTRRGRRSWEDSSSRARHQRGVPGGFEVELPDPGRYRLKVMAMERIEVRSEPLEFDGMTAPPLFEAFMQPAAVLSALVEDAGGRPVEGVALRVVEHARSQDASLPRRQQRSGPSTRTGDDGVARINLGGGGLYRVASGSSGWLDDNPFQVTPGPPVQRTYRLPATGDLRIRLTDEQGQPIKRPKVTVRARGRKRLYEVLRRSSPRATVDQVVIEVLPPGEYTVTVKAGGFEPHQEVVSVLGNRMSNATVRLRPAPPVDRSKPAKKTKRGAGRGR